MIRGHCLCGKCRYEARSAPRWIGYCHCQSCRRAVGAPVAAYAGFAKNDIRFLTGTPKLYESSPGVLRGFCQDCGSPLTYESSRWPDEIHLHLGSLEKLDAIAPQMHFHTEEKVQWLEIEDHLPRYPKAID